MDYYSLFWAPGVISMINEPRDAFTSQSSTLAALADSGPFHVLLLTGSGSRSDFHDLGTPGCAYVLVINTHSFGRFWPVSWTITLILGLGVISMIDEHRGAFMCRSSTLAVLADYGPFHGVLRTVLWYRSDFNN